MKKPNPSINELLIISSFVMVALALHQKLIISKLKLNNGKLKNDEDH